MADATDGWRYLVLYDGECGMCDRSVQWLLRHDHRRVLRFTPLQGETARPYVGGATTFSTMVLVERGAGGERVYQRSRAVLRILRALGGAWHLIAWLRVLPDLLIDLPYRVIARYRYRWFGHADACRIPDPATRQLFLP